MYLKLFLMTLVAVIVSVFFYILQKKTTFGKLSDKVQQVIIGLTFGGVAVLGTEFGVPYNDVIINARDAAPLCAGLLFGGPAGIIAGLIGGVERWLCVLWGGGAYSRIACSLSTALAGFYAAFLRKNMFDNKRPTWSFGFAVGLVMEIFHMTVLFMTHLGNAEQAYEVVKKATAPMVVCNALSVMLAVIAISLLSHGFHRNAGKAKCAKISQEVQAGLLVCVLIAYLATTTFVFILQTNTAKTDATKLLRTNIIDVQSEVHKAISGKNGSSVLNAITSHRHLGESGYLMVAESNMHILSNRLGHSGSNLESIGPAADAYVAENTLLRGVFYEEDSYWMYHTVDGYYIVAVLPMSEVMGTRDNAMYLNSFMEILVFAVLFAFIYFLIKNLVVNNIRNINKSLGSIIEGNLDVTVDVRSSEEFSSLSDDINSTVSTLKHYISEAAARIDQELSFAKSIQHSSLPSVFPAFPNISEFDIYASMDTAKMVGGDFYDFYMLDDKHLAILIADVSGKGVPAALFMMTTKTMLKSLAESGRSVDDVFTHANQRLCEGNDADMFVTAWMGILDITTGHMTFANAGHNPPLLYRKGEDYTYFKSKANLVLACMDDTRYALQTLDLNAGDKLFLYTDGVTEADNAQQELYGEERLKCYLNAHAVCTPEETLRGVRADVQVFAGDAEQFDDITMLMIAYNGNSNQDEMEERIFAADDAHLPELSAWVEETLENAGCDMKASMQILIALEEIFVNIAHYAYPGKSGEAKVALSVKENKCTLRFTDSGIPFNPLNKEDPDLSVDAQEHTVGGLGIFMVKKTMDSVTYASRNGCNILTIVKTIH